MRRFKHISLMLAALVALMSGDALWAKNGHGGPKGGGGKSHQGGSSFHGHGGSRGKSDAGSTQRGTGKSSFAANRDAKRSSFKSEGRQAHFAPRTTHDHRGDGARPVPGQHYAREQRKLDHRQRVADHLREVSDRNGNEHLKQVADDMDLRAQAHYDKRMEKINQKYGQGGTEAADAEAPENDADHPLGGAGETHDDSADFFNSTNKKLDEVGRKLTGRENAAARQLRNEVRNLTRRMEAVERMRALGEQAGDESMLQAADRLEQQALDHFHQRMDKLGEFRQRHGLPDIEHHHAP